MEVKKYKTKPVEIEAVYFDPDDVNSICSIQEWVNSNSKEDVCGISCGGELIIYTLEGNMYSKPGCYILRGTEGEFYPVKKSIFERKYEEE